MNDRVTAWVALGANLGDARSAVEAAFGALAGLPDTLLQARSSLYRSAPQEASGPDFVNAVARLHTGLDAAELLARLFEIEQEAGRQRSTRNAPRTLDLDLLAWGDRASSDPALTLPHPRLHQRAFVLLPLLELEPALALPGLGALHDWLPGVADQRIQRIA